MKFTPYSRYIHIEPVYDDPPKSNSLVVLPTDYKKPERRYALGKVLSVADDVRLCLEKDEIVIFEKRMLNRIEVFGKLYYLVLENYICGGLTDET